MLRTHTIQVWLCEVLFDVRIRGISWEHVLAFKFQLHCPLSPVSALVKRKPIAIKQKKDRHFVTALDRGLQGSALLQPRRRGIDGQ